MARRFQHLDGKIRARRGGIAVAPRAGFRLCVMALVACVLWLASGPCGPAHAQPVGPHAAVSAVIEAPAAGRAFDLGLGIACACQNVCHLLSVIAPAPPPLDTTFAVESALWSDAVSAALPRRTPSLLERPPRG